MSDDKIKVVGYAQKVTYTDGIEYRNFTPDLVGLQLTSNGGTPLFTLGGFTITTNMVAKLNKIFNTRAFSNFVTLSDLNITLEESQTLLNDNGDAVLNLDKTNLNYYALFGSFTEFVRVSLENIITTWPASLYLSPIAQSLNGDDLDGFTFEDYIYDSLTEKSTFRVDTNFINNQFTINYLKNGDVINTFNATNNLRNLTVSYLSYVIYYENNEYNILNFTGSTYEKNDYIYFEVKGNPFSGLTSQSKANYHIKPSKIKQDEFFYNLPEFESYLLNRKVTPIYTSTYYYPVKNEIGIITYITDTITWPVTDGYNIDFDTDQYVNFVSKLLDITNNNDSVKSNLMTRFLVSESITSFDTLPVHLSEMSQDTSGQKVNKLLNLYGREYDELNKYITGIAFANTVTYDKQDNTPDLYLKNLGRVLGWNVISSVIENDLLKNYVSTSNSTYSGMSVGLTPTEADIELWRRLILNTPWLWKSKGTRKSVEFLLKFIGAPEGLIQFNEYIYKAKAPIDIDLFLEVLELNDLDTDLSIYPIDSEGYPRPFPNNENMYFQNNGLWYRETGGANANIDITIGNNPHVGEYDGGFKYINQFKTLIPNFTPVSVTSQVITTDTTQLFTNYELGTMNNYTGDTYVESMDIDGTDLSDCVVVVSEIVQDPLPSIDINNCGCSTESDDDVLKICVSGNTNFVLSQITCPQMFSPPSINLDEGLYEFEYYQYDISGNQLSIPYSSQFTSQECCRYIGGTPHFENETADVNGRIVIVNSGYLCCDDSGKAGCTITCREKWTPILTPLLLPVLNDSYSGIQQRYLTFTKLDGTVGIVTPDGCNCMANKTIAIPNITDPNTGEIGYACQLTNIGLVDLALGVNSQIYSYYSDKNNGIINCYS
jgi:hypothetical protein